MTAYEKLTDARRLIDEALLELRPPVPSPALKLVHWNTHHGGVGSDGKMNVQGITDWLVKFKPDIVSLNELEENDGYGNSDQLEQHRAALQAQQGVPWYSLFCTMTGGSKLQGGGIGLLSKFPLDVPMRRGLTAGRPLLAAQQPFGSLFTTHPVSDNAGYRAAQISEVASLLPVASAFVLCGDFNASPGSSELNPLGQFSDAWLEAKKLGTATSFTADGATKSHRIDYVFFRGLVVASCDVPDTRTNGVFPSDHHPVVVTFK